MEKMSPKSQSAGGRRRLPDESSTSEEILEALREMGTGDAKWREGRTFSLVYHAGDEHTALLKSASELYFAENALNPMAFGSLKRMENEVVGMALDLLGAPEGAAGSMTSGGTESILMAMKTYRDRARALRPEVTQPEVVMPSTAHPAFHKAAHYLGLKAVAVPVGRDYRADVTSMQEAISDSTIALVGSAPSYPQGVMDPIGEIAELAASKGLPMHVDACVGGYLLPFVRELGYPVPAFDFRVPGVTSISADLHKYGFAAKGASTILYRDRSLRKYQIYVYSDWPGGLFASMTLLGTRAGGPIAAAWASLMRMGRAGFLKTAGEVMRTAQAFMEGIVKIPGLFIVGEPAMSVFAFASSEVNLHVVADQMEARGWHCDRQMNPTSIHLMITPSHVGLVDRYLGDLAEAVAYARAHPEAAGAGTAAMYGMLANAPDPAMLRDFLADFVDGIYQG
jgi:glutamate/tyrosine decarboxylase-like PLP-dependent enzyme